VNINLSEARGKKVSTRSVRCMAVFAGFLMVNGGLCHQGCAAQAEADPQLGGTPISGEISRPAPANVQRAGIQGGEIGQLRSLILNQNKAIEELKAKLSQQESMIQALQKQRDAETKGDAGNSEEPSGNPESASLLPLGSPPTGTTGGTSPAQSNVVSAKDEKKAEEKPAASALSINGFKFSGDFRFRADAQVRSGNSVAPPLQNVRARYRIRLNVDKSIDPLFNFHLQVSTAPINNQITNDQDFAGMASKHPFFISEGYVDFHPGKIFSIRGGRMEEVFADNNRFLWDDDVRFDGFHQIVKAPISGNSSVELRFAEYWLSNPGVYILGPTSPYVASGYQPGQKVRDANLFHTGAVLNLGSSGAWKHQLIGDVEFYRNHNQIQLASTAGTVNGFQVLVNGAIGLVVSGPTTGTGNATTTNGGAIYTAPDFHIVRASYRIEHKGVKLGEKEMPLWFNFQVARNYRATFLRDAVMGTVNLGAVKKAGDVRVLYQYAIKDANSLISQFTDDDLGTGSGVNIAVHAIRFDVGLTRFLQWQNLFFIQNERRGNNPAEFFFVPLQRGANRTYRYLGQLAFTF
jgi:putative porin